MRPSAILQPIKRAVAPSPEQSSTNPPAPKPSQEFKMPAAMSKKSYGLVKPKETEPAPKDVHAPSEEFEEPQAIKKRRYGAPTREQVEQDYSIEKEEIEVAPDAVGKSADVSKMNAAYGY